ncbi:MAG: YdcF family protein [Clostridia bacterium]|nr:YdcF family protein [Clostridia bacterium]
MKLSRIKDCDINGEIVQRVVFDGVEDKSGETGDCMLVLGGMCPLIDRVPKAAELYTAGVCRHAVFSGGVEWDTVYGRMTEADSMARLAEELGMAREHIIRDNLATTTEENMVCGALAIGRELGFERVKRVLLITSLYHMKRSKLIADLYLPPYMESICCPAYGYITPEDWESDSEKRRKTLREVSMTRLLIEQGFIKDMEV